MKNAKIGTGLVLDAQKLATGVSACIGIRGSGKTNGAAVIAERVLDAGIPVIVIDQVGPWFSLRLAKDGKHPSPYAIPVLGGSHGDIALLPQTGRQVAEALAQSGSSAVLDVSMMRKGERVRFAADFAEAFFEAMKRNKRPVLLVVEESQRFMPQVMRFSDPALSRCLGAFEEIAEVGRNFGIGMVLISQRPQQINKNVLFLSDTLFAFRTLGVAERKTIAEWVKEKGAAGREEVADELPGLKAGNAVVWSPAVFEVYGHFKIDLKETYDASATPDKALAAVRTKPLDLSALERTMATVVAEAKANDPAVLKAQVADLKRQLEKRAAARPVASPKVVEKPVLTEAQIGKMQRLLDRYEKVAQMSEETRIVVGGHFKALRDAIAARVVGALRQDLSRATGVPESLLFHPLEGRPSATATMMRPLSSPIVDSAAPGGDVGGVKLNRAAERKVLEVLATYGQRTKAQLAILAGYAVGGGGFNGALSKLKGVGYIVGDGQTFDITDAGRGAIGTVQPLPRGPALVAHWMAQMSRAAERELLRVLAEAYPDALTKEEAAKRTNPPYEPGGGGFNGAISKLRTLGLISGRAELRASEALFT